jgi:hypothetical protein
LLERSHGSATRSAVVGAWAGSAPDGLPAHVLSAQVDLWWPNEEEVGVAERLHPARHALADPEVLKVLGPRPTDAKLHARWRDGAATLDLYRARWGEVPALDRSRSDRTSLTAMEPRQLADYLRARDMVRSFSGDLASRSRGGHGRG